MNAKELREKYLQFFKKRDHAIIPSASLIPENDPTVLFTTAGMHPLVPYLMGEKHPEGKRLVNVQKCIRTSDIDEVGNTTHHTFFEMLGNWSLNDYSKEEAIKMSFEFLTKELGIDINKLAVSVFDPSAGSGQEVNMDAPFDEEAFEIWKGLGILEKNIAKLPKSENWWGPAGITGPCGPDTEMFYYVGEERGIKIPGFRDDSENSNWIEIWNDVFMQYNKMEDGSYELSEQKNIDTGMGLERMVACLNGFDDNYKTELWTGLIKKIEELSGKTYGKDKETTRMMRIIADHIKAATFIIGDDRGVPPSNIDQGYIARRLLRRAVICGKKIGIDQTKNWMGDIALEVIYIYSKEYSELRNNSNFIISTIFEEEVKFQKTLEKGLKEFKKWVKIAVGWEEEGEDRLKEKIDSAPKEIPGQIIFKLFATFGFPIEIIEEIAQEKGLQVDKKGFEEEMKKHQELSRTASAGKFKGGLADAGEETKKLHTAAHLLLAALRQVLGDYVTQKGSNITAERLRFDFSHGEKMTDEEKAKVEELVNQAISNNLPIVCDEMDLEEAKKGGAMGAFESKYGNKVKVYKAGDFSNEICGGPHVENTGELGKFKIKKEQSSSAGVRRIKAVLE